MRDLRVSFPEPCGEKWDDMRPDGCDRFCERCDKVIHDLSIMTLAETEELVRAGGQVCVRAQLEPDGSVKLKSSRDGRRMIAAIGVSAGLLVTGSPAFASGDSVLGAIKGKVDGACGYEFVVATAADGRTYRAKVGSNGRYKVKHLPAGAYEVQVEHGNAPKVSSVVVETGKTTAVNLDDALTCIVVGMLEIQETNG